MMASCRRRLYCHLEEALSSWCGLGHSRYVLGNIEINFLKKLKNALFGQGCLLLGLTCCGTEIRRHCVRWIKEQVFSGVVNKARVSQKCPWSLRLSLSAERLMAGPQSSADQAREVTSRDRKLTSCCLLYC